MKFAALIAVLLHVLASAAWFGSMFYSLAVMQPRAKAFFATDAEFEEFVATISAGARWKVLGAFALVALSGAALLVFAWPGSRLTSWTVLIACKVALFIAALIVFCYVSWRLWPRRVLASPAEIPMMQRRFRIVGFSMIALVGLNIILGVVAHAWR